MKSLAAISVFTVTILLGSVACKNGSNTPQSDSPEKAGMVLVGRDMITDVILRPDTLGDPWEYEKVKGFDGNIMYASLLEQIYSKKLTVYDCLSDEVLKPDDVKKIEAEFNSDLTKIAKIQFLEDWYFNPSGNDLMKKVKSVSLGYEVTRSGGLPPAYLPLFRVIME